MKKILLIVATLSCSHANSQGQLTSVQACYPLNCDHAQNFSPSGSALDGTPYNVICATGHKGIPLSAYEFLGSPTSYIELPNSPVLKAPQVCISLWVNFNSLSGPQYLVFTKNSCSSWFEGYALVYSAGKFYVIKNAGGGTPGNPCAMALQGGAVVTNNTFPTVAVGKWYHIVFYIDGQKLWLFVDGQFQGQTNNLGVIDYDPTRSVILGGTNEPSFNPFNFNGIMDDVRFFAAELTHVDVLDLYQLSPACPGAPYAKTTGMTTNDAQSEMINVFPNPSSGFFTVQKRGEFSLMITDLTGRVVDYNETQNAEYSEISMRDNKSGLYILNIYSKDSKLIESKKLVVE